MGADKDTIFSVLDFEEMLWAEHASTIGSNADSQIDMYTENHYAQPMNSAGMSNLATHFQSNDPYPITKDTRLAYACKQNYIIDPTGWSIQPIGMANWPKCSGEKKHHGLSWSGLGRTCALQWKLTLIAHILSMVSHPTFRSSV